MAMTNDPPRIKFPRGIIFGTAPSSLIYRSYSGPMEVFTIPKVLSIITECTLEGYEIFDLAYYVLDNDEMQIRILMGRDYVYISNS